MTEMLNLRPRGLLCMLLILCLAVVLPTQAEETDLVKLQVRINSLIPGEKDYYGRNILHIRRIIGHIGEGSEQFKPQWLKDSPAYFCK